MGKNRLRLLIICNNDNCNTHIAVQQLISNKFGGNEFIEISDLNFYPYDTSKKYDAKEQEICKKIPYVDSIKCKYCGKCIDKCKIGGITFNRHIPLLTFDKANCLSCFACLKSCNIAAIGQKDFQIGISITHKPDSNQIFKAYRFKNISLYKKHIASELNNLKSDILQIGIINSDNHLLLNKISAEEVIAIAAEELDSSKAVSDRKIKD